jgi:hypothetical protein
MASAAQGSCSSEMLPTANYSGLMIMDQDDTQEYYSSVSDQGSYIDGDASDDSHAVILPWRKTLVSDDSNHDDHYSDDDLFSGEITDYGPHYFVPRAHPIEMGSVPKSLIQDSSSFPSEGSLGSMSQEPSSRPNFPLSDEQRNIGPLELDSDTPDICVPAPINRFLKEYQRTGVKFFLDKYRKNHGGILGDDMGFVRIVSCFKYHIANVMSSPGWEKQYK